MPPVLVSALDTCGALKHSTQPSVQTYPRRRLFLNKEFYCRPAAVDVVSVVGSRRRPQHPASQGRVVTYSPPTVADSLRGISSKLAANLVVLPLPPSIRGDVFLQLTSTKRPVPDTECHQSIVGAGPPKRSQHSVAPVTLTSGWACRRWRASGVDRSPYGWPTASRNPQPAKTTATYNAKQPKQ